MSRAAPEYHDDQLYDDAEVVHQPEAYEVARYLMGATGRGTVIDIGCGSGRKLRSLSSPRAIGIDFGHNSAFCRTAYPDFGEWLRSTCQIRVRG